MINELMKRLSELPNVTMDDGQEYIQLYDAMETVKRALEQEPIGDLISRQAVLDMLEDINAETEGVGFYYEHYVDYIKALPSVKPQEKIGQFVKWVATEIFDEWKYNKDTFAEIACRKLAKLGIVRAKGDEWELVESQEGAKKK